MFICPLHCCLTSWSAWPDHGANMNFARDKASFCKIFKNTLQVKNFTLKVLNEVYFVIFVFFGLCCMLSYPNHSVYEISMTQTYLYLRS